MHLFIQFQTKYKAQNIIEIVSLKRMTVVLDWSCDDV